MVNHRGSSAFGDAPTYNDTWVTAHVESVGGADLVIGLAFENSLNSLFSIPFFPCLPPAEAAIYREASFTKAKASYWEAGNKQERSSGVDRAGKLIEN